MLSYWEKESFTRYEHIVIGSGIVGLSAALELRSHFPTADILVLERGLLPTGASTRNAGFACTGSATEILDDLREQSPSAVVELVARRKQGLEALRRRLPDAVLGYSETGGHEVLTDADDPVFSKLGELNDLLQPVLGPGAFQPAHADRGTLGLDTALIRGLIRNKGEGAIHSGNAVRGLLALCRSAGIGLMTGAMVREIMEGDHFAELVLDAPHTPDTLRLRAATVTVCTNAFTSQLIPGIDLRPGRGQVLVTERIPGLKLKGVFHYDRGFYYFREIDGRVLLGGGRNLDFAGESTTEIALHEAIQADLESKLRAWIIPHHPAVRIEHRWAGIMAFGADKTPIVKQFSRRLFGAFRMGGMGVALGSTAAAEVAVLVKRG